MEAEDAEVTGGRCQLSLQIFLLVSYTFHVGRGFTRARVSLGLSVFVLEALLCESARAGSDVKLWRRVVNQLFASLC